MTTFRCWGTTILGPWYKAGVFALAFLPLFADGELDRAARAYRDKPTPAERAALERIAAGGGQDGALAHLTLGVTDLEDGEHDRALPHFTAARKAMPLLNDYVAYWIAAVHVAAKNQGAIPGTLDAVYRSQPASPLVGRAAYVEAKARLDSGDPKGALELINRYLDKMNQPAGLLLQGQVQEALGDWPAAAASYQGVHYGFPQTPEATEASQGIGRAQEALGDRYQPPTPRQRIDRATKLMENRGAAQARAEFERMISLLAGADWDTARVRVGAAEYQERKTELALRHLTNLKVETPEADAERLYYISACLRRLERDEELLAAVDQLSAKYPQSPWRLKALTSTAGYFLQENDAARFAPLYQACAVSFPDSEDGPMCHWKVAWRTYLERKPAADAMFREHLRKYPGSDKAGASLYYLGRLAEQRGDRTAARRFYQEVVKRFPNYYYALPARQQLARQEIAQAGPSTETESFLAVIRYPDRPTAAAFQPAPGFETRVARARLLARAALDTWSDGELRYAARNEGQGMAAALELAELAAKRGQPQMGLNYIRAHAPNYLFIPMNEGPARFWKLAFPRVYWPQTYMYAKERGIDENILLGLIRQESGFDARIVSYAGAIGLTQVMPGTGRELARRVGLRNYRTSLLKSPEVNLRLGTYYLKDLTNTLEGNIEQALASYNGGLTRVRKWREWGPFKEISEMIETIPITQTREYVQIIMRNADIYRQLYGNEPAPPPPAVAKAEPPPEPAASSKSAKKNVSKKSKRR